MRQRESEFVEWVLENPPVRLPGAAAIFTAGASGIPLALTQRTTCGTTAFCTSVCCSFRQSAATRRASIRSCE
jgi:hypothetical protein